MRESCASMRGSCASMRESVHTRIHAREQNMALLALPGGSAVLAGTWFLSPVAREARL